MSKKIRLIVGIDEVGRGPLAGPVSVGVFMADRETGDWILKNIFENKLRDSKKLSAKRREEIYKKLCELKKEKSSTKLKDSRVYFSVISISNKVIDKKGINFAIKIGIDKSLNTKHKSNDRFKCVFNEIRLDGLLKAPEKYKNQKTIVKGDEKDVFIACASIVAKVSRDRLMCRLAKKYPKYHLEIHKGYGTLLHRNLIKKFGLSPLHRKTFCKKYI